MKKIGNTICVIAGCMTMGIGVIGIVLPILPTAPFFLLTALLFAKGSQRFHHWFVKTGLYRKYIEQAFYKKEMTVRNKGKMMLMLGIIFAAGFWFTPVWYAKLLIGLIAAGHLYYFLVKVRTVKEMKQAAERT